MHIQLRFFAGLREALGTSGERIQVPQHVATAGDVLDLLRRRGGPWDAALGPERAYRIAVDQRMGGLASAIHDGAELAVLPPVTGG